MFAKLWKLLTDANAWDQYKASGGFSIPWAQVLRFALGAFGILATQGVLPAGAAGWWTGIAALATAFGIKVGDPNVPLADQLTALSAEDKAGILKMLTDAHYGAAAPPVQVVPKK